MSIEGGPFNCSITDETFERTDITGWNNHCQKHEGYHNFSGTTVCDELGCNNQLRFTKYPYIPLVPESGHLARPVRLYCSEHGGDKMNPQGVEVTAMTGEKKELGDSQAT